jgi:hypothetical protein
VVLHLFFYTVSWVKRRKKKKRETMAQQTAQTVQALQALMVADPTEQDALITTLKETREALKQRLAEREWRESAAYFMRTRGQVLTTKAREIEQLEGEVRDLSVHFVAQPSLWMQWAWLLLGVVMATLLTFFVLGEDAFLFFTKSHKTSECSPLRQHHPPPPPSLHQHQRRLHRVVKDG